MGTDGRDGSRSGSPAKWGNDPAARSSRGSSRIAHETIGTRGTAVDGAGTAGAPEQNAPVHGGASGGAVGRSGPPMASATESPATNRSTAEGVTPLEPAR